MTRMIFCLLDRVLGFGRLLDARREGMETLDGC